MNCFVAKSVTIILESLAERVHRFYCTIKQPSLITMTFLLLFPDADKAAEPSEDEDEDMAILTHKSQTGKELLYKDFFNPQTRRRSKFTQRSKCRQREEVSEV